MMRIEDVARYPLPGYALPTAYRFSPDDRTLTFLASPEDGLRLALFGMDPETGVRRILLDPRDGGVREGQVSLEEALRRERLRQRSVGVTSYQWADRDSAAGLRMLVPLGGALLVKDGPDAPARELIPAGGPPAIDARLSPDGSHVAFVRDAELYVVSASGGEPRQVTSGARGTGRTNGLAEYVAQEEMHRHQGYWWSDDGSMLAFEEVDETHIPVYRIVHQGKDAVGDAAQEDHRYPFAGAANAKVRLGVVSRDGGEVVWIDLGDFEYLARVQWAADGALWVQTQDRLQQRLDLMRCDPRTGRSTLVLRETSASWVNLHFMLRFLPPCAAAPDGGFLWGSERDGFQHLYVFDMGGRLIRQVTQGQWMVDALVGVDARRGLAWITGTLDGPTQRHLYEVPLVGGTPRRITAERGVHDVVLDHGKRRFVDIHSATDRAPRVELKSLDDGRVLRPLHTAVDPRIASLGLTPPELVALPSRDGVTLHAALYRPGAEHGTGPWPTIVSVYGGPHVQRVQDSWELTAGMRAQYFRSLGFLVFVLDNRGSARRGLAFESAIYRNMGDIEVKDQEDGVRWLVANGLAAPGRVGIYGWSYGGYMAAMCLARAPETFRCACAGAPVTHWDGYDTHYTERYMGTPENNAEGYRVSSVMQHVGAMRGSLMLVHGLLDENVHFRHTARLLNAIVRHRKPHELVLFPDERHMPRGEADRIYIEERARDFFVRELKGPSGNN
ncbi:MAG: S9 family peptidase [Planctomycetes bacterium]|nr:S9 family peptidase [Planctomycetota bacterium]